MNRLCCGLLIVVALAGVVPEPARAGVLDRSVRAAAGRLVRFGGQEVARDGEEVLARRVGALAVCQGDEALDVVSQAGPRALRFVEGASNPAGRIDRLLIREGDAAAPFLVRPGWVAEPVVEVFGFPAARALGSVSPSNSLQLARMAGAGKYAQPGRAAELLGIVGRHGDRALGFVWRNKGSLAVTTALVAFLRDPDPFLDGVRDLAGVLAREIARPVAQIPGAVVTEVIRQLDWTTPVVLLAALAGSAGIHLGLVAWRRRPQDQRRGREETDCGRAV